MTLGFAALPRWGKITLALGGLYVVTFSSLAIALAIVWSANGGRLLP